MIQYARLVEKDTSVKAIGVLKEPTATEPGICDFRFRPQYSVFDWGVMPMPDGKVMDNRPVAVVAAFNYEMIKRESVPVCYIGTVGSDGTAHPFSHFVETGEIPQSIRVRMVHVIKPTFRDREWDYSVFRDPKVDGERVNNWMHPIEFIWRAEAGPDSSFWKNITDKVYELHDFGLPLKLKPGDKFPVPVLDHSSKYEKHDRYSPPDEARRLANISYKGWTELNYYRRIINRALTDHAASRGIKRPDGKQEFAIITENGTPIQTLADVAGTWHEDRFEYTTSSGVIVKVSKQTPRDLNRILNKAWAEQCQLAKTRAEVEGIENWKTLVTLQPKPLEPAFFDQYNNLMRAATNAWIGSGLFSGASGLEEACKEFDSYLSDYKRRLQSQAA